MIKVGFFMVQVGVQRDKRWRASRVEAEGY